MKDKTENLKYQDCGCPVEYPCTGAHPEIKRDEVCEHHGYKKYCFICLKKERDELWEALIRKTKEWDSANQSLYEEMQKVKNLSKGTKLKKYWCEHIETNMSGELYFRGQWGRPLVMDDYLFCPICGKKQKV